MVGDRSGNSLTDEKKATPAIWRGTIVNNDEAKVTTAGFLLTLRPSEA